MSIMVCLHVDDHAVMLCLSQCDHPGSYKPTGPLSSGAVSITYLHYTSSLERWRRGVMIITPHIIYPRIGYLSIIGIYWFFILTARSTCKPLIMTLLEL